MSSICGSDMHPYAGRGVVLDDGITFGHEYTGVIVAVGDEVSQCHAQSYPILCHDTIVLWPSPSQMTHTCQELTWFQLYALKHCT